MSPQRVAAGENDATPLVDRVVHDLKGSLAPLQTAAYLLGRDDLPPERRHELLDTLQRQSRRLGQMIDEAGDWARASQGRLVTRRASCDLAMLLDNAIGGIPGCHVEPVIPAELVNRAIVGDEGRLLQMLAALIGHACARSSGQRPRLVLTAVAGRVRIAISDEGPTPDAVALAGLLEQPLPEPADAGLGLRLMIARAIVLGHGGTLLAQANPAGRGQLLVCELPIDSAPA